MEDMLERALEPEKVQPNVDGEVGTAKGECVGIIQIVVRKWLRP